MISRTFGRPAPVNVMLVPLLLACFAVNNPAVSADPAAASANVSVSVKFSGASASVLDDALRVILQPPTNSPRTYYVAYPAPGPLEPTILVFFEPGTDPKTAMSIVESRVQSFKDGLPSAAEREGITVAQPDTSPLIYVTVLSTDELQNECYLYNYCKVNILPEIKRLESIDNGGLVGYRRRTLRLIVDLDRLRTGNMPLKDIGNALQGCSMIGGSIKEINRTPQSVEYILSGQPCSARPEQYEGIILKASPEGQILRLRDVAKIDMTDSYDPAWAAAAHPSARIVLKVRPDVKFSAAIEEVRKKLAELKATTFPPGLTCEVREEFPASWKSPLNSSSSDRRTPTDR